MTRRQKQVLEFGHEHGFYQRRDTRDGAALNNNGLQLKLDVF